jgi:hypothetical protein
VRRPCELCAAAGTAQNRAGIIAATSHIDLNLIRPSTEKPTENGCDSKSDSANRLNVNECKGAETAGWAE